MRVHLRMIFLVCDFPLHAGCTAGGPQTSCSEKNHEAEPLEIGSASFKVKKDSRRGDLLPHPFDCMSSEIADDRPGFFFSKSFFQVAGRFSAPRYKHSAAAAISRPIAAMRFSMRVLIWLTLFRPRWNSATVSSSECPSWT